MFDSQGNCEVSYNAVASEIQSFDFMISDVDNGAQGAVAYLHDIKNTNVKVLSMGAYGAEPFGMLAADDPNYLACVNIDAWVLAQTVIDSAINYFKGVENPVNTYTDLYVVDSSNVGDFWLEAE